MRIFLRNFIDAVSFADYPTGDWHHGLGTILMIVATAVAAIVGAAIIAYILRTADLVVWNWKISSGLMSVLHAIAGIAYAKIMRERVLYAMQEWDGKYRIISSDGEEDHRCFVVPTNVDPDSKEYREAMQLAEGDSELFELLKPEGGRVIRKYTQVDEKNGNEYTYLLTYLHKEAREKDVKDAVNRYFYEEYRKTLREVRRNPDPNTIYFGAGHLA